jgi:hypothetical protein
VLVTPEIDPPEGPFVPAADVPRPRLLRPPVLRSGSSSDFSGFDRVISAKSATVL